MTFTDVQRLLTRIQYKPEWKFAVFDGNSSLPSQLHFPGCFVFCGFVRTRHAHIAGHPEIRVPAIFACPKSIVEVWGCAEDVTNLVWEHLIMRWEKHESMEWFKLDGQNVFEDILIEEHAK
jgi:hypothetical protein